ncbi:hypothetical protein P3W45_001733 [Vairimorpha bombi]
MELGVLLDTISFIRIIKEKESVENGTGVIINQLIKIITGYTIIYLMPTVSDYFLTKLYRICVCFYITKALNINHKVYNEMGSGHVRSIIDRKAYNFAVGFDVVLFKFMYTFLYCVVSLYILFYFFDFLVFLYAIVSLSLVLLVNMPIINLRNKFRFAYTRRYDLLIRTIYRIISSYDIIKANNKEQDELDNLDTYLVEVEEYGIICAFYASLGAFLSRCYIIIPNGIFFFCVLSRNRLISVKTGEDFVLFNSLFCAIKSKIVILRDQYTKVSQLFIDIISDDWDQIPCDIENMELYYKYQKDDENREIEFKNIEQSVSLDKNEDMCMNTKNNKELSRVEMDMELIKKSVIETQQFYRHESSDGENEFLFKKYIKFQEFCLLVNGRILINSANFKIFKGQKVGLVGKNGTGKSTLLNVFLRYRDYKGGLYIDDSEMKTINKIDQRSKISYIPQTPGILSGTISDNLLYNNKPNNFINLVKLCDFYNMKFDDLEKDVGENGKFLSGGQKQRISFLRGVIKNGDIFILDEPTASMDPNSEANLIDKLHTHLNDKTVIAIIHNHSLLKRFDKILGIVNNEIRVYESYEEFKKEGFLY